MEPDSLNQLGERSKQDFVAPARKADASQPRLNRSYQRHALKAWGPDYRSNQGDGKYTAKVGERWLGRVRESWGKHSGRGLLKEGPEADWGGVSCPCSRDKEVVVIEKRRNQVVRVSRSLAVSAMVFLIICS